MLKEKDKRRKVISLFSKHCKNNSWGKVYGAERLSEYLYPLLNKSNLSLRKKFVDEWSDILETVINKPEKTILSKPENRALYDFLESYVEDQLYDELSLHDNSSSYKHIIEMMENLNIPKTSHESSYVDEIVEHLYVVSNLITDEVFSNKATKLGNDFELLDTKSEFLAIKEYKKNIYKVCYLLPKTVETELDKNIRFLRGIIISTKGKPREEFIGLLIDEINNELYFIRLANFYYISQSRQAYNLNTGSRKSLDSLHLKIEGIGNNFSHCLRSDSQIPTFTGDVMIGSLHDFRASAVNKNVKIKSELIKNYIDKLELL